MTEERRCDDCEVKVQRLAQRVDGIDMRVRQLEYSDEKRDAAFSRHMEKEEAAFEQFYKELRALRDQISGLVTAALRDRNDLERDIANQFARQDETARNRFVTKNEVRVGWAVAMAVLAGAVWFFTYTQEHGTAQKLDQMADRILEELRK